jgi:hypothetical protein
MQSIRLLALGALASGCNLLGSNGLNVNYDLQPQEYAQDFGSTMGTFPTVSCAAGGDAVCQQVPGLPMGSTASCDPTSTNCILTQDVRLTQQVNLSQEQGFPSSVANSSAIDHVTVGAVHYWTPTNTLTIDTPPIDVYVGSQSAKTETDPGVVKLGTLPSLPAGTRTSCGSGAPGTADSKCDMPLTDAGKAALSALAKDYRTPFNVLVVAHVLVTGGEPVPAGKLDLFVQPTVTFEILGH